MEIFKRFKFTVRQKEVMLAIRGPGTLKEIGHNLGISYGTMQYHLRIVYNKVGIHCTSGSCRGRYLLMRKMYGYELNK